MIRFDNVDIVQRQLRAMPSKALQALSGAVQQEAETIMTESKRIVPVDTGTLRASGIVAAPDVKGDTVTVELGYGGAAKAYALIQHEREDFTHPGQGTAKYLERPVNAAEAGFGKRVGKTLEKRLL